MTDGVPDVVGLLSQRSALLLLREFQDNPALANYVVNRMSTTVQELEERGVTLDPVAFESVTDIMVKQFAASCLAMQALIARCNCVPKDSDDDADDDAADVAF